MSKQPTTCQFVAVACFGDHDRSRLAGICTPASSVAQKCLGNHDCR